MRRHYRTPRWHGRAPAYLFTEDLDGTGSPKRIDLPCMIPLGCRDARKAVSTANLQQAYATVKAVAKTADYRASRGDREKSTREPLPGVIARKRPV